MEPWYHGLHLGLCWQIASERRQVVQQELVVGTLFHLSSWGSYSLCFFKQTCADDALDLSLSIFQFVPVNYISHLKFEILGLVCSASASVTVFPVKLTKVKT